MSKFAKGLVTGLMIGVVIGLLAAPREGSETRKRVKNFIDHILSKSAYLNIGERP